MTKQKVLVFIVAYHAERHIASVLDRIPKELINSDEVHILLIDDASKDRSAEVAANWASEHKCSNITILRNPVNQGYGGNQKIGYRYAIDNGFDFVILLHGDGQYAPELLPNFIDVWKQSKPSVVLGSRMHSAASALKGGMPLYKLVGNKILTTFQNTLTGQSLSEYHTGYRAYSTDYLRSVPFEIDTNDFHFDTEILLQAFHANARIVEFPIPTHYGDEICRVNGIRYALDVVLATLQYRLSRFGMFCSLKYKNLGSSMYQNKTDQKYSSHAKALSLIEKYNPKTILDIGCGPGFIAAKCQSKGRKVTGLDQYEPASHNGMEGFVQADLDNELPVDALSYDAVLMLDVIEHLSHPEEFMVRLRNKTKADLVVGKVPTMIISTPNIAFIAIRLNLLLGRFNYAERGILDITHRRLFTWGALRKLLVDCGYEIQEWQPIGAPFELVVPGSLGAFLASASDFFARLMPELFAFQFIVVAKPKPGVLQLLQASENIYDGDVQQIDNRSKELVGTR